MPQRQLYDYFSTQGQPYKRESPILTLPRAIRENIYTWANPRPNRLIDLNYWAQQQSPSIHYTDGVLDAYLDKDLRQQRDYERRSLLDQLPFSLLFVCKRISREAEDMLYGHNCFAISQRSPGGLQALGRLGAHAIQSLQTLIVHLTPCTCIASHCIQKPRRLPHDGISFQESVFDRSYSNAAQRGHDRQLSNVSRTDRGIIEQWKQGCARLAAHVTPGRLTLYVICHVQSKHVAEQILEPLLQLPTLRHCGICLGPSHHLESSTLRALAKRVVEQLTTHELAATRAPFPFLSLPRELQLQVLDASPLVLDSHIHICAGRVARYSFPHSCDEEGIMRSEEPLLPTACFCLRHCSAFRTGCHPYQHAYLEQLLGVSKALADLATEVFYARNVFAIYTWQPQTTWEDTRDLAGVFQFLSGLARHALHYLTQVTILLPPIDRASLLDTQLDWESWQESIHLLASQATLPRLVLSIKIGTCQGQRQGQRGHLTEEDEHQTLYVYEEIFRPLAQLARLKALFIHVPCPFGRDREKERVEIEQKLERIAMGPSYDAYRVGKPLPDDYTRPFLYDPGA
ncbi:Nn.00g088630.m01.CDS01 [Neocucurbitaria sp. VM-36]